MKSKTLLQRYSAVVAAAAALCVLSTGAFVGASIANADPNAAGVTTANIDATKQNQTSITIHKYQGPATGTRSDGTVQTITDKKPVRGVEFKIWRVSAKGAEEALDLAKPEDWQKINPLLKLVGANKKTASELVNGKDAELTLSKQPVDTLTTDDNGSASKNKLPMGLYYVEETDVSNATVDGKKVTVTGKVVPFFVTTPLPHPSDHTWIYDVHVYPKNDTSNDTPTKTPGKLSKKYITTDTDEGETSIEWNITIPLVAPAQGQEYKSIKFADPFPTSLTNYKAKNDKQVKDVKLEFVDKSGKSADNVTAVTLSGEKSADSSGNSVDADYTVTDIVADTTKGGGVTVALTKEGLQKASAFFKAHPSADAKTARLSATIVAVVRDPTNITNNLNIDVDGNYKIGDVDNPTPCPDGNCGDTPHDTAHFARLAITKVAGEKGKDGTETSTDKKPLEGAKFAIYARKEAPGADDTQEKNYGVTKDNLTTMTEQVTYKKDGKFENKILTTGKDGKAQVKLYAGDDKDATTGKVYCLVETEAPAGYKKDETPKCYMLTQENTTEAAATTAKTGNQHEIVNLRASGLDEILGSLPMTGASGLVVLTTVGLLGVAGTFFFIVWRRKKEQE